MSLKFSVAINTYNRAELLRETLHSVLGQSHAPAQVVVVDDGGTDHTALVAESFGGRVEYLRQQNMGIGGSRNTAILACQQPWVAFCDDDDLWSPNYLEVLSKAIRLHPDAGILFTDFAIVQENTWQFGSTKFQKAPADFWKLPSTWQGNIQRVDVPLYLQNLKYQPFFPSATAVRREVIDRVGLNKLTLSRIGSSDWEFTLRLLEHSPTILIHQPLVGIRKHAGNFSGALLKTILGEIDILEEAVRTHKTAKEHERIVRNHILEKVLRANHLAFREDRFDVIREHRRKYGSVSMSWRDTVKQHVACLPPVLAHPVRSWLIWMSRQFRSRSPT